MELERSKRLDHTNPSVGIDEMDDYQATYNKRLQNQSFLSAHVFTFVGSRRPQHSRPAALAATPNHDEMLSFGWVIDLVELSTRVGKQPNFDSTCFSGCGFCFATRLYNRNDSHLAMSDLHSSYWSERCAYQREIARSDPNGVLLLKWQRRANTF